MDEDDDDNMDHMNSSEEEEDDGVSDESSADEENGDEDERDGNSEEEDDEEEEEEEEEDDNREDGEEGGDSEEEDEGSDGEDEGEGREGADWDGIDLDRPVTSHPYLQDKYPGIRLPLALRDVVTLERAQEILMGVPGEESLKFPVTGRMDRFYCDGRRLNDDVAIMDQMFSLVIFGPSGTLPATIVPEYMPNLETLEIRNTGSSQEREGDMDEFSFPKEIIEQLNITSLIIHNSATNIIRQFYPLQKIRYLCIGDRFSERQYRIASNKPLVELITVFQQDTNADDDGGTSTEMATTPFRRSIEQLAVIADPVTVDQFCDFILLFTPDKYPSLKWLFIGGTRTVSAAHVDALVRRLTSLIDDRGNENKKTMYKPPKLTRLPLDSQSRCFYNIAGLQSILSLLNILDTVKETHYHPEADARHLRPEENERGHPEYKKLLHQIMFRLNYTYARFPVGAPIATRSVANRRKHNQQRIDNDSNDRQNSGGGGVGSSTPTSAIPLSLWPNLIRRAGQYFPYYGLNGEVIGPLTRAVVQISDEMEKDVLQCRASTIFVLLRNGLAGNMDWHDQYRRHGRHVEPSATSIDNPTPKGSTNSTNRKRRRSHEEE